MTTAAPVMRGRPRHSSIDQAIMGATVRMLGEVGYQSLSMAGVAATAGVGRPALYRRFPSKRDLVVAAILDLTDAPEPALPEETRGALAALLGATAEALARPGGMAILGSLLTQEARDPELITLFRERVFAPRQAVIHALLQQGIDAGDVRPDLDLEVADALLFGALLARATLGEPVDDAWRDRVINQVWKAIKSMGPVIK
jgi:AcrR family transcriptional regulator